jgi:hypothetical protein
MHIPLKYGFNSKQKIIIGDAVNRSKNGEYGRSFATCLNCWLRNKVFGKNSLFTVETLFHRDMQIAKETE